MRTFLNVLWHIPFLGFLLSFIYFISGILLCCTIILIPVGLGYFQMAMFMMSPFSKGMVTKRELMEFSGQRYNSTSAWQMFCTLARIVYFIPSLFAALGALVVIVAEFISLIGIPCGIVYAKLLSSIFNPINKVCVPKAVADEIANKKNRAILSGYAAPCASAAASAAGSAAASATSEELGMVAGFDDEKLKSILREKALYTPGIVAACEREVLARAAGETHAAPIVEPERADANESTASCDFVPGNSDWHNIGQRIMAIVPKAPVVLLLLSLLGMGLITQLAQVLLNAADVYFSNYSMLYLFWNLLFIAGTGWMMVEAYQREKLNFAIPFALLMVGRLVLAYTNVQFIASSDYDASGAFFNNFPTALTLLACIALTFTKVRMAVYGGGALIGIIVLQVFMGSFLFGTVYAPDSYGLRGDIEFLMAIHTVFQTILNMLAIPAWLLICLAFYELRSAQPIAKKAVEVETPVADSKAEVPVAASEIETPVAASEEDDSEKISPEDNSRFMPH